MKIDLMPPFSNDYKSGYLLTNKEPRNLVVLVRADNTKTTVSYARYLYSCKVGRYLSKLEHVDHIDNDKTNDVIENLQVLTQKENNLKSQTHFTSPVSFTCPICSAIFELPKHRTYKKTQPCCSRKCGGIKSAQTVLKNRESLL